MPKRVTLKAISERCGVSHVAVGAALGAHGHGSRVRLSPEKASEIRRVAAEMGYQENRLAQALRAQRTHTVGVLFRVMSNPQQVSYLIDCLHRELYKQGYLAHLWPFHSSFALFDRGIRDLVGWQVDGLLVSHLFASDDRAGQWPALEAWLNGLRLPIVMVESNLVTASPLPRFGVDLAGAAATAARHLARLGHRRLAFVGAGRGRDNERFHAARDAVAGSGTEVKFHILEVARSSRPTHELVESTGALADRLAALPDRPTGYICANDVIAAVLIAAFRRHGLAVPGQVSVVGFDNDAAAVIGDPPLTTFEPPMAEVARQAVHRLLALVDGEAPPAADVCLPTEFIERLSTGPAPA